METDGVPAGRLSSESSGRDHLQVLLQLLDATVSRQRHHWVQQNQQLRTQLLDREMELQEVREQVWVLRRQAEEQQRVQREAAMGFQEHLVQLQTQLENLRESYDRAVRRRRRAEPDTSLQSRSLSVKLEEFQRKSKEWEEQRASLREHLASLEANRRSLAAKCRRFQNWITGGIYGETLDVDLPWLEVKEEDEATSWERGLEKQHLLQHLECEQEKQQKLEEELCELRAEFQAALDLLQATQLEGSEWQTEVLRLREQLLVQKSATWPGKDSAGMEETAQQQPDGSSQQGVLHLGDTSSLQTGTEASRSLGVPLRDVLQRTGDQLRREEHAGKLKDDIVQLREELQRLWCESSGTAALRAKLGAREDSVDSAVGQDRGCQVAKMQSEVLGSGLVSQKESETEVLDHVRDPPPHNIPRDPEPQCKKKPTAGVCHDNVDINQLSGCGEPTGTRDPASADGASAAPEHVPRHHGNNQIREEPRGERGGVSVFSDTPPCRCWSLATDRFFQEEERRMKGLERRFDSYINELFRNIQGALRGYGGCWPLPTTASPGTTGV